MRARSASNNNYLHSLQAWLITVKLHVCSAGSAVKQSVCYDTLNRIGTIFLPGKFHDIYVVLIRLFS